MKFILALLKPGKQLKFKLKLFF